ncbi:VOC family protein [Pseudooceanicola sp. CBS1P-1]|uniref:VOC family protein n=1 Tax=Pseudooceanicola albus TaxID=2692189 RepID=A0A6L7G3U3_9RHOB|nr:MULTISPECIES: VOC family protein [Pseudooceanicola]MBT9385235.1 VOC family protein [Pseudooceanicola endophyticus]MXN18681.1 VOC family protein [Pseudooceanicola albus]
MTDRPFRPRALGEIALRCRDFPAMLRFYGQVLGLPRLSGSARGTPGEGIAFFALGESHGGHVAVLALFAAPPDTDPPATGAGSSLHHLALSLPWEEQPRAEAWLREAGHEARWQAFPWAGWRGLFTRDPDGNTVELVAADPDWHVR